LSWGTVEKIGVIVVCSSAALAAVFVVWSVKSCSTRRRHAPKKLSNGVRDPLIGTDGCFMDDNGTSGDGTFPLPPESDGGRDTSTTGGTSVRESDGGEAAFGTPSSFLRSYSVDEADYTRFHTPGSPAAALPRFSDGGTNWDSKLEQAATASVMASVPSAYFIPYAQISMGETLGAGASGVVAEGRYYSTANTSSGETVVNKTRQGSSVPVACKQVLLDITDEEQELIGREVRILASLHHPNIVSAACASFPSPEYNVKPTPVFSGQLHWHIAVAAWPPSHYHRADG
jgi:hypothetical protein